MKNIFTVILVGLLASACATQSFTLQEGATELPQKEEMQSFYVSGVGQEKSVNASEVCGGADKVAKVESHLKFYDGFLSAITYGIYTPRTAKVYCVK